MKINQAKIIFLAISFKMRLSPFK